MCRESEAGRQIKSMMQVSPAAAWGRGIVGAAIGGVAGYFVFTWLLTQGFYGLALPAILLGLGFGAFSGRSMLTGGIFCAIAGVALMIFAEWATAPFVKDESLNFFLSNLSNLKPVTLGLMVLGGVGALWFGKGR